MPSPKKNKNIASVRVWKRTSRNGRQYCTVRLPDRKPVTRSCGTYHRSTAEGFGSILLKELMKPSQQATAIVEEQLELPPPENTAVRPDPL
jgi:hypothetical protein